MRHSRASIAEIAGPLESSMGNCARIIATVFVLFVAVLGSAAPAVAMSFAQPAVPSIEQSESKIAELNANQQLTEATRKASIAAYQAAIESLTKASDYTSKAAEFQKLASDAPQLLSAIRSELAQPPVDPIVTVPEGATLPQLELALTQATASLGAERQNLADLIAETSRRTEQGAALTTRLVKTRQLLVDLSNPAESGAQAELPPELVEAQNVAYRAQLRMYQSEIASIEAELASFDARRELLPARRDRAQRRVTESEKLVAAWQAVVAAQRKSSAEQAAQEAVRLRREAARQHPALTKFAEETVVIAKERVKSRTSNGNTETSTQRLARLRSELTDLNAEFLATQSRLTKSGLNRATGMLLRHQYESLPDLSSLAREVRTTQEALEELDFSLIELQEERIDFGDIDRVAQSMISKIPPREIESDQTELLTAARELASARRNLLDQLIGDVSSDFDTLVELNTTLRESVDTASEYKSFIEERILWVRSIAGDRAPRVSDLRHDALWLFDPSSWKHALLLTKTFVLSSWTRVSLVVACLLALYLVSFRCYRWLSILGERVSRYVTDSFRYTLIALCLTAVISAPLAGTLFAIGWLLKAPPNQETVALAFGQGLQSAAIFLYPLVFLRYMLRTKGLGISHFRWSKDTAIPMRKNLRWFIPLIVPIVLLVAVVDAGGDEASNASLGRILFTAEMLILTIFLHRVLRPTGPVLRRFIEANAGGWVHRLRYVWYLLAVLLPIAFIVLSWLGFHYTALQLQFRLEQSLILALILVVINDILHRWLYVARRRVAVEDAKRRRAQAIADAVASTVDSSESTAATMSVTPAMIDEEKVDLPALSEQTRQIFKTAITVSAIIGMYLIWAQALPALKMLDMIQVWPTVEIVESGASNSTAYTAVPTVSQSESSSMPLIPGGNLAQSARSVSESAESTIESITVADIGLSLVIFLATWIAFRNVPGLIEIVVLQRLPLDAGSRYALSTVLRYLIAIVGIVIAFQTVGISWSKVQWLAAALTFGLAFGLQEIFANFVSGLIILAERPIRLGDTVTVGGVTGTVMRIRMRATTITDWDRKELVIPNKTFITGDVINWTLTDPVLRVKILVGVSYSSDIDRVHAVLAKVAKKEPLVLADPPPTVLFKNFGDSTLDFELRVFIANIDHFVQVQNSLHIMIFKAFKDADIEIAFPQRDLHVRSIGDLSKLVERTDIPKPTE